MAGFSDALENAILDHYFGGPDKTRPATLYVGLSTTTPADDGSNFTEPSGSGYARVSKTNNATNFPAAAAGLKSNGTAVTFPQASGGSWGTVTHWGIFEASTGGSPTVWGALTSSKTIGDGDTPEFAIGALDITLD